jgi:hypothetical protein
MFPLVTLSSKKSEDKYTQTLTPVIQVSHTDFCHTTTVQCKFTLPTKCDHLQKPT